MRLDPSTREFRQHSGLLELSRGMGRIVVRIICPFCGERVTAYLWSLAGSGKKCPCGALLGQIGAHAPEIGR